MSSVSLCACVTVAERSLISLSSVLICWRALEQLIVRLEHALLAGRRPRCVRPRGLSRAPSRSTRTVSSSAAARRAVASGFDDAIGEPGFGLMQLRLVGGLHLRDLALERFARVAHLLLEIGLPLDELGLERRVAALQFGLRRSELVLEHRRTLFLVAECAQLGARVVQLTAGTLLQHAGRAQVVLGRGAARCGSRPVRHEAPRRPRPPRDRRAGARR